MRVFRLCLALSVWLWASVTWAADLPYEEINPPMPTETATGEVELVELFWYSCPHCYNFDPILKKWLETKPEYIKFRRMPAVYDNPRGMSLNKGFFTAEILGVLDKIHDPLFFAYHVKNQRFEDPRELRDLFVEQGVSAQDFETTFSSFPVDMKVRQARILTSRYGVREVPTLVLNGKYRLESGKVGGYKGLLELVEKLAAQEYAAMQKAQPAQDGGTVQQPAQ